MSKSNYASTSRQVLNEYQELRPSQLRPVSVATLIAAFPQLELRTNAQVAAHSAVSGVSIDNRRLQPGDAFLALPGLQVHGIKFAPAALAAGIRVVITDSRGWELWESAEFKNQFPQLTVPDLTVLVAPNILDMVGSLCALVYGQAWRDMQGYALTGTNGKTTTAYLLQDLLSKTGQSSAMIGTAQIILPQLIMPCAHHMTTPSPDILHQLLAVARQNQASSYVMEVSSHAIRQQRTNPIRYRVAGFSNLSHDHLDYHPDMEDYYLAKRALLEEKMSDIAVINIDDNYGWRAAAELSTDNRKRVVTLAHHRSGVEATWRVVEVDAGSHGTSFTLLGPARSIDEGSDLTGLSRYRLHVAMLGDFNVDNAALAFVMAWAGGLSETELQRLAHLTRSGDLWPSEQVPGRMEIVKVIDKSPEQRKSEKIVCPRVIVDFAHNPEAIQKMLAQIKTTTQGKIWVVIGSAGARDRIKRPQMGRVCATLADRVVITNDEPRDECAALIRAQLWYGANLAANEHKEKANAPVVQVYEIGDRSQAIFFAILSAEPGDTVVLAGRGHEDSFEEAGNKYHLLDAQEAQKALQMFVSRQIVVQRMQDGTINPQDLVQEFPGQQLFPGLSTRAAVTLSTEKK